MRNTSCVQNAINRESGQAIVREDYRENRKISPWVYVWIPVVLIFGVGDILTTQIALSLGAAERNGLVKFLIEGPGGLWAFGIVKAAILVPLVVISVYMEGMYRWLVPCFFLCAGICLLAVNLFVIGALL